ncbi:MAG: protein phosphatase [Desulfobacteraceae bacterium]|nr:dual specificity protein phosphatase family protein [Desulfobacteraceae bacterium]MBC2756803.1 protein phosphatase [Desulfobacteraceae bacterium]
MKSAPENGFLKKLFKALNIQSRLTEQLSKDKTGDSAYRITWITENLAVGYAPTSYVELDAIREHGVDAIINLCAEFCDLHEIEKKSGFEVYYFPIPDEHAPDMDEMEKALAWLDEAIYLGKKTLVHCCHGIGRTGTFVSSYFLRRGMGLKLSSKTLQHSRATPTNYDQWNLLKQYGKKTGTLKIREPSLENRQAVDLSPYFADYEALVRKIEEELKNPEKPDKVEARCGSETLDCCFEYFELQLIEVIYLINKTNKTLTSEKRLEVISDAVKISKKAKDLRRLLCKNKNNDRPVKDALVDASLIDAYRKKNILCPLNRDSKCLLYPHRPIRCRLHGVSEALINRHLINDMLFTLSSNVFFAFSGFFLENGALSFSLAETVSGKFVQEYFHFLTRSKKS